MSMKRTQPLKLTSHDELKDQLIGKQGTEARENYERELSAETMSDAIRAARLKRNLTQEQLGKLIGVQKAQISKLENGATNVSLDTVLRVFTALRARLSLSVEMLDKKVRVA